MTRRRKTVSVLQTVLVLAAVTGGLVSSGAFAATPQPAGSSEPAVPQPPAESPPTTDHTHPSATGAAAGHNAFNHAVQKAASALSSTVQCVNPHAPCAESERVIHTLRLLCDAYAKCDLATIEEYLDDGCTTFDEGTKRLVVGKQAVLADLKRKFEEHRPDGDAPIVAYTIDHPYAKVTGDTAVVTFVAIKEIGGKHPFKAESHITDVFVKRGDKWKKLHYRGRWRKIG